MPEGGDSQRVAAGWVPGPVGDMPACVAGPAQPCLQLTVIRKILGWSGFSLCAEPQQLLGGLPIRLP